ncbi:hypothetical protein SDC9_197408 [bioreactor metagenome]|uniref:Uncharacterized protein n=1 Tax=bioreactor metagenome TaxID=1076179 RepID=A0A645IFQ2_9ZZZZ
MWTAAQVGKTALGIGGNSTVFQFIDQFYLVIFVPSGEHTDCIGFRDTFTHNLFLGSDQLHHFVLDSRKIGLFDGHSFARIHIIVETVLNSRPNTEFYSGIKYLQRFRHQVS